MILTRQAAKSRGEGKRGDNDGERISGPDPYRNSEAYDERSAAAASAASYEPMPDPDIEAGTMCGIKPSESRDAE